MKIINRTEFDYDTKRDSFFKLQNLLKCKLEKNEKFLIGRLSGNETNFVGKYLKNNTITKHLVYSMSNNAGILLKNIEDIKQYITNYLDAVKNSDLLGIWTGGMLSQCMEFYKYLEETQINTNVIAAQSLEPYYYFEESEYYLDQIFKNKKILVLTSHSNTIKKQIKQLEKIYPDKKIFNDCQFFVYKTASQHCGNSDGNSWLYHFNNMKEDLKKIQRFYDFDIAFVGCGGFGMPICNYIYSELDKSALYIGGAIQLLFGVLGKRWNANKTINKIKNDYWCYPEDSDKHGKPELVEGGCYW